MCFGFRVFFGEISSRGEKKMLDFFVYTLVPGINLVLFSGRKQACVEISPYYFKNTYLVPGTMVYLL